MAFKWPISVYGVTIQIFQLSFLTLMYAGYQSIGIQMKDVFVVNRSLKLALCYP